MVTFNGNITLNSVTDKEMELIWGFKAKHGSNFTFTPNAMQTQVKQTGITVYNNVVFNYTDLHGFNLIAEIVNTLHKLEEPKPAAQ